MSRPPIPALRPLPKPGLFRRVPPMIFPTVLGALVLGLGWREGAGLFGLPGGLAEAFLGALVLLWAFTHAAYVAKLVRRPRALIEDLAILPGQVGLAAAGMSDYAVALALAPYAPDMARAILVVGLVVHALLMGTVVLGWRAGPAEARRVTPAWQWLFAGPMLGAPAALALGWPDLARGLVFATAPVAIALWAVGLRQLLDRIPPAPLRPLLALHFGSASVLGIAALGLGWPQAALACAALGLAMLGGCIVGLRWISVSGFTALWGAMTFSLSAFALLVLMLQGLSLAGGVLLVLATLMTLPILVRVLQDWARGRLSATTNAAEA